MATSRLEKIGTIFTRVQGLLKSGAMKWEDRPLWYDVYKAFPPAVEPKYARPAPETPIKSIFYKEDIIRAQYHKEIKPGTSNLLNDDYKTKTRRFIEAYTNLESSGSVTNQDEIFEMAVSAVNKELDDKKLTREQEKNNASLATSFKTAKEEHQPIKKIDVNEIMKDL